MQIGTRSFHRLHPLIDFKLKCMSNVGQVKIFYTLIMGKALYRYFVEIHELKMPLIQHTRDYGIPKNP